MVQALPQTSFNEHIDVLAAIDRDRGYLDQSDAEYLSLIRGATQLAKANPAEAAALRGAIYATALKYRASATAFEEALSLTREPSLRLFIAQAFLRIGRFSRVQELFRAYGDPALGHFGQWVVIAIFSGAFQTLVRFAGRAHDDLKLDSAQSEVVIQPAARILAARGLQETDVARLLDLTAEVTEKRRTGPPGLRSTDVTPFEPDQALLFEMHWPVTFEAAAEMNEELVDLIVEKFDPVPSGVLITFAGMQ